VDLDQALALTVTEPVQTTELGRVPAERSPQGTPPAIALSGVGKRFEEVVALRDFSLEVRRGEVVSFLGPSGCGKTTALRIIAGLETPTAGRVFIDGRDVTAVPSRHRGAVLVFQDYALFPHMTVFDNVAFGLRARRVPRKEQAERVRSVLSLVRLQHLERRRPAQLSGGQRQRVALARALVVQPVVLLLDEPLAALDRQLREAMQLELRSLIRSTGVTTLFVTHDQDEAMTISNRVVLMNDGAIVQAGSPAEIYDNPATRFAANFVGQANLWPVARRDGASFLELAGRSIPVSGGSDESHVVLRPERVHVASRSGAIAASCDVVLDGSVESYRYAGPALIATLRLSTGQALLATIEGRDRRTPPAEGDRVAAGFASTDLRLVR
jgi:ABC-type Fe3+/spermidine/putrescine transport system ATPase subunit